MLSEAMGIEASFEPFSFLASLEPEELDRLKRGASRRRYRKGAAILVEGEISDRVVAVLKGRSKISSSTEEGREVVLSMRGPGDLIGELSFLDGEPRSATALAVDEVEALVLAATDFRAFLEGAPRVTLVLMQMLSRRLREADLKLAEFTGHDSVGRVARRLVELAERYGKPVEEGGIQIDLPLSQEELAGWTGSSREAVSKALGSLRSLGWIRTRRRGFIIVDLAALRRRAA